MASANTLELRRSVARTKGFGFISNSRDSRQSGRIPIQYASESRQISHLREGKVKGPRPARNKSKAR